jgi:hypothetical protein
MYEIVIWGLSDRKHEYITNRGYKTENMYRIATSGLYKKISS